MKTNFKNSLWLAAILLTSFCATAQTKTKAKTADNDINHRSFDYVNSDDGNRTEKVQTEYKGKVYFLKLVNDKMVELTVDGEKIPEAEWNKYSDGVASIREEMRLQRERNKEQAKRNAEQAVRNEQQAKLNAEQRVRNDEQAKRNQEQARQNEIQNQKNAEQVVRNQEQAKLNAEQAKRNEQQDKLNAEQAVRNKEQAERNAVQAKKNEEQARANEQMMKEITEDLVSDKIIPDTNSLKEIRINEFGMSVNGVRQPDEVFKKYRKIFMKYNSSFEGSFNYSRDGVIEGQ
jgi:colicin import membrane protein